MTEEVKDQEPQEQAPETGPSDSGTEFLDFEKASPQQIEARFKRIYGNLKEYERGFEELATHNAKLAERLEKLESQGAQMTHTKEIEQAKSSLKAAIERGDVETQVQLSSKLTALQTQAIKTAEKLPAPSVPQPDRRYVQEWAKEVDPETQQFVRPWALEGHPRYQEAYALTEQLAGQIEDIDEILREVDKRMGFKPKKATQATVLSSGQRPPKSKGIELTPVQIDVARRMGIKPEDYKKQLEAMR